jgi:FlaA1/EpsC-like NDP-sugar epimerase
MKLGRIFSWLDPVFIALIYLGFTWLTDPTFRGVSGLIPLVEIGFLYVPIVALKFQYRIWSEVSVQDMLDFFKVIGVFFAGIVGLSLLGGVRLEYLGAVAAVIVYLFSSRFAGRIIQEFRHPKKGDSVLIYGAGEAGSLLFKSIHPNKNVIAFIDDDPRKASQLLHSRPIHLMNDSMYDFIRDHHIKEVYVAIPSLSRVSLQHIAKTFIAVGVNVLVLPSFEEVDKNQYQLQPKKIHILDLLGRDEVQLDLTGVQELLTNKKVLITGAGGSIGSELARQIAAFPIRQLILLDHTENGLFFVHQELMKSQNEIVALIASVQDQERLDEIFLTYKPEYVFHAAAHKHVGMMEHSPSEAIKNNVFGSLNVMNTAIKYKVKNVILISSDKAVRPSNVMGASKQIVERLMQTLPSFSTVLSAVRFGNVLGSNGSVIPIFDQQISKGGPVTVTDPDVTRYFMTIPEAVRLVLESVRYANQGNIFILDMGRPMRIQELAEQMIRLAGFVPHKDIMIEYIGLGPGEKMFEELVIDKANTTTTPNAKIFLETTPHPPLNYSRINDFKYYQEVIQDILHGESNVS